MGRWQDTSPGIKTALAVATGFGFGLSPIASGTVGTFWGLPLAWWFVQLPVPWQIAVALALATLAVPFCDKAEAWFGHKDDGRIVADEYLTFPIAVIGLPLHQAPLMLVVAFVVCRIFDIVKPWPARKLQDCHGGYGIVIDDVFASAYALAANWVFYLLVYPRLIPLVERYWPY
jgi:phosphatidylglycerophosphatase A